MLGLCWTPASVQGMQKVASTMPSNPEQLLGAILVRKDIFNRFETTMHDTCLDANNLLEYLFSLYNSTAAPAERENHPAGQVLGFVHKDSSCNKKVSGRGQLVFPNQPAVGNSHFPHPNIQARSSESRPHQSGINDGHRKKMKLEPTGFQGDVVNLAVNHQDYGQSVSLKPFDNQANFSGPNSSQAPIVKRELTSSDVESRHAQPPSSSLPPFSQICRQGSRPYSPASAQYAETLATSQHKDGSKSFNMNVRADPGSADLKMEVDGAHPGVLGNHQAPKNAPNMHKLAKKFKVKGSSSLPTDGGSSSNNGERIGRKKKTHQCFCGALFTRADNLKRHIRKCHKEKITGGLLESHVDNSGLPGADDFSHAFPSGGQDGIEASQPLNSHTSQPHQAQHHHQQREEHHLQQREEHHLQQREEHHLQREEHHLQQREEHHLQQREEHHLQQREEHRLQQREEHHHQPQDNSVVKSTSGVKWSCFCGENFDDHYRLVQHTRTHEGHL